MSTNLAPLKIAKEFADLDYNEDLGEGLPEGFSSIRFKGKTWVLRHRGENYMFTRSDDGTASPYIDVVILARSPNISRAYYPGQYNEDNAGAPVCTSLDGENVDPGVPDPQAKCCAVCPRNQWYDDEGRRKKDCQDHRRMAVLLDFDITRKMLGSPLVEPVFLKIPPGSFATLKKYGSYLKDRQAPWPAVVTRISFAPEKQFQMTFDVKGPLPGSSAEAVRPLLQDSQTKRLIGEASVLREVEEQEIPWEAPKQVTGTAGKSTVVDKPKPVKEAQQEVLPPTKRGPGRPKKIKDDNGGMAMASGFGAVNSEEASLRVEEEAGGEFVDADDELKSRVDRMMGD